MMETIMEIKMDPAAVAEVLWEKIEPRLEELVRDQFGDLKRRIDEMNGQAVPLYIKPSNVRQLFDVGKDKIYEWIREGKLSVHQPTADKHLKVSELIELFESEKVAKITPLRKVN